MSPTSSPVIDDLLAQIKRLPGPKIVTLAQGAGVFKIDIDPQGVCGYGPGHELVFLAKLVRALHEGGGLMIRQFLSAKVQRRTPNGKLMWIPEKNLYGLHLGDGEVHPLSAEVVRDASCTDPATGAPLEPEAGVHYCTWGEQ